VDFGHTDCDKAEAVDLALRQTKAPTVAGTRAVVRSTISSSDVTP
jgi:hypothetical protein